MTTDRSHEPSEADHGTARHPLPDTPATKQVVAELCEALEETAAKIENQVQVTRAYLTDNGLDDNFSDILLSHYLDFAREARTALSKARGAAG